MGTRNITRVICNGEVKVNQYCQWDGYPTGRGADVLKFMHTILNDGRFPAFKKTVENSMLFVSNDDADIFYTVAPILGSVYDKISELEKTIKLPICGKPFHRKVEIALKENLINLNEATYLMTASRDTGNDILPWMLDNRCPDGMIFYSTDYLSGITEELDWQIEGMFVINLDNDTVKIIWHGASVEYPFEMVRYFDEKTIKKEMERLEKADEES